jgi:hypothetical protein
VKAKRKAQPAPAVEDPRDVALRGAYRQVHELREALRDVFAFYEKRRETYGIADVLRIGKARALAFRETEEGSDEAARVP